jgi:propionate CoA-transferase
LTEVAPGIRVQEHIMPAVAFPFKTSPDVKEMDRRIFTSGPMGIKGDPPWM